MDRITGLVQRNVWLLPLSILVLLLIGFVLGLVTGWFTVDFKPNADDVLAAANSVGNDAPLAQRLLKNLSKEEAAQIIGSLITTRTNAGKTDDANRLRDLARARNVNLSPAGSGTPVAPVTPIATRAPSGATTASSSNNTLLTLALGLIGLGVLVALGYFLLTRFRPNLGRRRARPDRTTYVEPSVETPDGQIIDGEIAQVVPTSTPSVSRVSASGPYQATYNLGNDSYEASYSLDSAKSEVRGECGVGISEMIGEGKPDKVTAFDLWLYDRKDVHTLTLVIMSEYAYQDQALRTRLLTKGELILAEKGKRLHLETHSFRMDARIAEVVYETDPSMPPNSYFKKLVIEIAPTYKDGAAVR